jgi:hypothetical protein
MTQSTNTGSNGNGHAGDAPEATLIGVILDRSGSMASVCEPTIAGFNEFLHTQQRQHDGGRAIMSLTQFDDRYEVNFIGEPIENVPDLDTESYVPRGMTALYDAIGRTIHEIEAWTRAENWQERVLVLIVTDGQENASREYNSDAVSALIDQKERDGWNFAYMGANQDSYAVSDSLNIRADYTANYDATAGGTAENYKRMASAASKWRASKAKGMSAPAFFDDSPQKTAADAPAGKLTPKGAGAATSGDSTRSPRPGRVEPRTGRLNVKRATGSGN